MNTETYERLEAAAFAAWPSLEPEEMVSGWCLRFAGGYTKRANSANCTLAAAELDADRLAEIERRYRQRGLPAIFRLTSVATPPDADEALSARGYRLVDPSSVMVLPLPDAAEAGQSPHLLDVDAWGAVYQRISGAAPSGQDTHLRMLRAISGKCAFAVEPPGANPACCGLGVLSAESLGLFDLATIPAQRRTGQATALCRKLLAWGQEAGATQAYLQVMDANAGAIRLYEKLGFRHGYRYWYRISA